MLRRRVSSMVGLPDAACESDRFGLPRFYFAGCEEAQRAQPSRAERIFWWTVISISIVMALASTAVLITSVISP